MENEEMKMGKIDNRHTWLTHPTATEELKRLIAEHPDYPITVIAGEEANNGDYCWMYCTQVTVGIEEILDCNTEYWTSEYVCTDRDDFEDEACDMIWDGLQEELGRKPTDEEVKAEWLNVKEAHEPYWKKCIAIKAWN